VLLVADRTDTPQPAAASGASPNLSPTKRYSHLARESGPHGACPSGSGQAAAGYSTAYPLPLREVLRSIGQQLDLQGLLQPLSELSSRPDGNAEVPCGAVFDNKNPRFPGIFLLLEPSDGLEPSTPSLPWRFLGVTRVHTRSLTAQFLLQIGLLQAVEMRRETSRVSFLMCPFCVRAVLPD
jgi:hypothetical protein